jgi:addiction module HigA family antidote
MKKINIPKANPTQWMNERFKLEQIHPGPLIVTYFMRPQQIAPERLASETGLSREQITEILEGKSKITAQIAECFERCFNWPARILVLWQVNYDIQVELLGQEKWLAEAKLHLLGQELFLAEVENKIKTLKKDRADVRKLIPAPKAR